MNLRDCSASFYAVNDPPGRHGMGITFWCPLCVKANLPLHQRAMLPVAFANPLDGGPPMQARTLWTRTGDTLETLVLSPSINADNQEHVGHKGWHGHIQATKEHPEGGQLVGGGL